MKKNYEKPEVELEKFQVEEVLTASGKFEDSKAEDSDVSGF